MTATTRKLAPVGSAPWIVSERRQANELVDQEVEEFEYSVRNEMEWLNEHMHDIFAGNNMNVADIFKTPGKLRGKTPRTARKLNALGQRAPLTDIFAPNPQANTSPTKTQFYKQVAQFQVAEDASNENQPPVAASAEKSRHVQRSKYGDSGYHGTTDDEMEVDRPQTVSAPAPVFSPPKEVTQASSAPKARFASLPREEQEATETEESFVSAKESTSRKASREDFRRDDDASSTVPDDNEAELETVESAPVVEPVEAVESALIAQEESALVQEPDCEPVEDDLDRMDEDDVRSPSDKSSPVKPLLRKSSLTFSSLPAREPLAHKKSMGARNSRTSHLAGRFTGGKSLGGQQNAPNSQDDAIDVEELDKPALEREESETTKRHHQTTTQGLRDRINMLGKSRDSRLSKSIPNLSSIASQSIYPQLPQLDKAESEIVRPTSRPDLNKQLPANPAQDDDDDDDWIKPIKSAAMAEKEAPMPALSRTRTAESIRQNGKAKETEAEMAAPTQQDSPKRRFSPSRPKLPFGHKKTVSASVITSPTHAAMAPTINQKSISVSNPALQSENTTTTPAGSPRRHLDGAVSATKAKLYSALRSAKGIFASSAGVSAQAKMEALASPARPRQAEDMFNDVFSPTEETAPEPALYPDLLNRVTSAESTASRATEGRRTRSSSEREQRKQDEQRKMGGDLDKAREKEKQKAIVAASKLQISPPKERLAAQRPMAPSSAESEKNEEFASADEMPPPPAPRSMLPTTQSQRLREPRRIVKPVKDAVQPKTRPTPVPIRMPSQRIGHAQSQSQAPSTTDLSRSLHESLQNPAASGKTALHAKSSSASLHASTSNNSLHKASGSTVAAKRTLEAAAKKKEQETKAAQRKAEQKREMEQRRAAKAEDERRRQEEERRKQDEERRRLEDERRAEQQRRAAEQQRRDEAKRAAQRQAAEAKRMEQQRKEAQRAQAQTQQNEFAYALQQDKLNQQATHGRGELGGPRPISRMAPEPQRPIQVNPAKPAKRALQGEHDDEHYSRPAVQRNPPSYQQNDAKRRKTDEDEPQELRRSVMAPPVRQSNIRKVSRMPSSCLPKANKPKENKFPHGYAPAPPAHHPAPSMFVKTVTAQHQVHHGQAGHHKDMAKFANAHIPFANPSGPSNAQHKTPGRPIPNGALKSAAKSSPLYPNGDNIDLPEIASDSEDEEEDFQAPDWVNSPALRELLSQQQLVDPEAIFGPIAPLKMEEVFKNKDRHKKFRDRTSSANWNGQDRLTEEERQRDREAREKMMRDGGWTFQPN
ncbi:Benzoate 4-monooxygenase [Venturia nashicola]|uniref:Benzoate 4-monooxygenase n=1 Tax=Venturia nashicola TaxID=86259 RepID=A0A4Z1P8W1_9PEZI|nr:Benzoate 4-monooxygenase [Venturia nashicola]TLD25988.1 Benzoate 4-monooxygenase [Venturia nashicola]